MRSLCEFWRKLLFLFRRERFERDLEEEIRFHLEMKAQDNRDAGMNPEPASIAARRQFGNELVLREASRETWSWRWLDALARDIRYGLRGFRRSPGFTAVAVLTLALGLGANTLIFTLLYNVVLRPLPYPDADRLVNLYLTLAADSRGARDISFSYPKFQQLQRAATAFDSMAAYGQRRYTITYPGPAEEVRGEIATAGYFPMLGFTPAMGRTFLPEEDGEPGAHAVAIISDGLWRGRFGADPDVLGKSLRIEGKALRVVGVMPAEVRGDSGSAELWIPFSMAAPEQLTGRSMHWHRAIARVKAGITVQRAASEVRGIMRRIEREHPSPGRGFWDANAVLLSESKIDRGLAKGLVVLYAAVGFVLLIACANLANLTMARMVGRQREIAIRLAIGAGRASLVRQVLVENVLLSITGGAAGTLLAIWSMRLLGAVRPEAANALWPNYLRQLDARALSVTAPVAGFSLVLSLAVGILFGLAPAIRASGGSVSDVLKGGAPGRRQRHGTAGFRRFLLAGQMALVVVLLVAAGLMIRSFARLAGAPLGLETRNILTVPLPLPYQKYTGAAGRQLFDNLLAEVRALPGVEVASLSSDLPALARDTVTDVQALDSRPTKGYIGWHSVDPGFFELFRIPMRSGRRFTERDRQGRPVVILSEQAGRVLFPGQDPVGHQIKAQNADCEIVGVAAEVHYENQRQQLAIAGDMYMAPARPSRSVLIVRASRSPMALLPAIRNAVRRLDPEIPMQGVRTMQDNVFLVHSYEHFGTLLMGAFAALALGLAVVGIYGVFSYAVAARTREFGIRVAAGACRADILRLVLREAALLCGAGLALGIPAATAATRVLGSMVSGADGSDPWIYATAAAVLVGTALAASYLPARRAARLDPLQALRSE